jgi:hypothetical protein
MKTSRVCIMFCLIVIQSWSQQDTIPGSGLWLHDCWSNYLDAGYKSGLFTGFILGIIKDDEARVSIGKGAKFFSIPETTTYGQINSVVGKYIDDHPEEWHSPASVIVISALIQTWPSKK